MSDVAQVDLVRKALTSGLSNCVLWVNDKTITIVENSLANTGLTAEIIKKLVISHAKAGGIIDARIEDRDHWKQLRSHWYRVIVPVEKMPNGLFVEMALVDDDPDVPVVFLLDAHRQVR